MARQKAARVPVAKTYKLYIDGAWVDPVAPKAIDVIDVLSDLFLTRGVPSAFGAPVAL